MAQSLQEIKDILTTVFDTYEEKQIQRLVNTSKLTVEELYELRGKAAACRDLAHAIHNQLGQ